MGTQPDAFGAFEIAESLDEQPIEARAGAFLARLSRDE